MPTNNLKALKALSSQMPGMNQQLQKQQQAANDILFAQNLSGAVNKPNQSALPAIGQATQGAGQIQVEGAQQAAQGAQQIGQLGMQAQQQANSLQNQTQQRNLQQKSFEGESRLARIDQNMKKELFDGRLSLQNDIANNKFMSERQLADLALLKGVNSEKLADYQQTIEQATQRKLQMMEFAYKKVMQAKQQASAMGNQKAQQELDSTLIQLKRAAERTAQKKAQKAGIFGAILQGGLTAVGAVAGSFFGPGGTAAGATLGGGLGQGISGIVNSQQG